MKATPLLLLTCLLCAPAFAEELTTGNLVPGMEDFTTSGGTSFGTGAGCSSGAYCTSGTTGGGGTYTSSFDVPLTQAEINQGFTLNSALTVNSHPSNAQLSTCSDGVLQSGDCRDIFSLTVTLQDAGTTVETFTHQAEMDFSGLQNFTFTDVVATNNYGVLTGIYELFGIDAGFPSGFYGPQFSNPSLTIDYQTAFVQEEVLAAITEQIETQTQDIIQAAVAPDPAPLAPPPLAEPVVALATFDATPTVPAPVVDVVPVTVVDIPAATETLTPIVALATFDTTPTVPAPTVDAVPVVVVDIPTTTETLAPTSSVATVAPPPVAPTIQPIAPVSETQQTQESAAEAQIEAAVEAPSPEPTVEAAAEPEATEAAEPEATEAPTAEAAPEPKAASKPTKPAARQKVATASLSEVSVAAVSVPVTPAMAAQTVVDAIAPSQKYGAAAQTVTLIAMGVIAENRSLFRGPGIPDAVAGFFSTATIPDGPSMVDRMTNYRFSGQANGAHNALVESQWSK